jgi:glycerol-3-phosphate dehydrogenase
MILSFLVVAELTTAVACRSFLQPGFSSYITLAISAIQTMSLPLSELLNRNNLLQRLQQESDWDVVVIGGGATGLGIAVDASSRGYKTLLLEQSDFAKGTSSRSTKLVHGGVRYLAQGNIPLVYSALKERGLMLQNAPHVVTKRAFIIPCFSWGEKLKYLVGLKLYDLLSGKWSFGKSRLLGKAEVLQQLPALNEKALKGGVLYYDGQFDDARLAVNLVQTAARHDTVLLNYMKVTALQKSGSRITGIIAHDVETGIEYKIQAKAVINATGVFADAIHHMDVPGSKPLLRQSQGVHLVFDASHFPATSALMIPKTPDGRVLFAIPWHGHMVVGTTDTPVPTRLLDPVPLDTEIHFILETLNPFLKEPVSIKDIRSVFAGLRPLVLPQKDVVSTKELSRDHKIVVSASGLITIIGGKWTTYRKMAEDAVNTAIKTVKLEPKQCVTKTLRLHGFTTETRTDHLALYGSDAMAILKSWESNTALQNPLHPKFPNTEAEVLWAVHNESARTVEDVLARRLRLLFVDAAVALETAPRVAQLLREQLGKDETWEKASLQQFMQVASLYLIHVSKTEATKPSLTN